MQSSSERDGMTVAVCTLGKVRIEWATNLTRITRIINLRAELKIVMGYSVADARNVAIHEATQDNAKYILFWDDDMIPLTTAEHLKLYTEMERHPDIDVMGGVYPTRRADAPEPVVVKEYQKGIWWGWQDGQIHEAYMVGTGFMIVRLESLLKCDVPEYEVGQMTVRKYIDEDMDCSDDFSFARMCAENGLKTYIHGSVRCAQIGIDGEWYRLPEVQEETELERLYTEVNKYVTDGWRSDKNSYHSYIHVYAEKCRKDASILELGVTPPSLLLWRRYFTGDVVGVDISERSVPEGVEFIKADATKPIPQLEGRAFDYIVDDASHTIDDQVASFKLFYPLLKEGGSYFIEDIQNLAEFRKAFPIGEVIDLRHERPFAPDNIIIEVKYEADPLRLLRQIPDRGLAAGARASGL